MTDRKERLASLAARAGRPKVAPDPISTTGTTVATSSAGDDEEANKQQEARTIKFRNYTPADPNLEKKQQTSEDSQFKEPAAKKVKAEKSELQLALDKAKQEAAMAVSAAGVHAGAGGASLDMDDVNIIAAAPKKINWDLKRDIQPKLDKLERRTQKAIVELLRERLEREAAQDDID